MSVLPTGIAAASGGYEISRSVRLRSSATGYFSRTLGAGGGTTKNVFSAWVKRGALGTTQGIFQGRQDASNQQYISFTSGDAIEVTVYASAAYVLQKITAQVFRDPSAWYHILVRQDTTLASAEDRFQLWVNGVRVTAWATNTNTSVQNTAYFFGTANPHYLGSFFGSSTLDGYLTETNFVYQPTTVPAATEFGEFDAITGVWKPKKYTGTYGTNGFYLNFSDNSAATAAAIGKDSSGNGNNWTPNNISVTAGVTYDSMLDTPTPYADGGNGRGNYGIINPLDGTFPDNKPTNANLTLGSGSNWNTCRGNWGMSSGKWYWETVHSVYNQSICGIADKDWPTSTYYPGYSSTGYSAGFGNAGYKYVDGAAGAVYGSAFNIGDVIGYALDMDAGTLTCYINGVSQGTMVSGLTGTIFPAIAAANTAVINANFGQRPFSYTPPTGFKALNTQNLPDGTITKGNKHFDATIYTGNGGTLSVVNSGGFQPDLVWIKNRATAGTDNVLVDSVRGTNGTTYYRLFSDLTNAESANNANSVSALNSNGFTVIGTSPNIDVNENAKALVGWQWKANGAAVSNTSGSITSQVSANTTAGFSVVTYTGNGSTGTVGHGLGVAPKFIITKYRNVINAWQCYHASLGAGYKLYLNQTDAQTASSTVWNNTSPTSSVFSVGDANTNASAGTYVAYCFSEVAGYSKFGSYTGNGSADGPFVYLGFKPKLVITKSYDATAGIGDWTIHDTSRLPYNTNDLRLFANASSAESTSEAMDMLSNGFKIRATNSNCNTSGGGYIFMAFAENPFKNSLAR